MNRITKISLISAIVYLILVILSLNIEITVKNKSIPVSHEIVLVEQPMIYTWDSGEECIDHN